jgi:signal transduction histidine kinase
LGVRGAVAVGLLGVVMTGALFGWLWAKADRDAAAQLESQLESVVESTGDALDQVSERLVSLAGLFRSSVLVAPDEFDTFTEDIGLTEGMSGLGYIAKVDGDAVGRFEDLLEANQGIPIETCRFDDDGAYVALQPGDQHFLLQYVTPTSEWGHLIGYDLGSDPRVAAAIAQASDTGRPILTPFLRLSSDPEDDVAVMALSVSHSNPDMDDVLVGTIINFEDLVTANIPTGVDQHVTIWYSEGAPTDSADISGDLEYGGQVWTIFIEANPDSPFSVDRSGAAAVLVVGLLASILALLLVNLMRHRMEASTALAAAHQATEAKDRFIASVSHELRTPLTAVLGFAEILKTPNDLTVEERTTVMTTITDEATDLAHLIDDLLVAARGEIGQLSISREPVVVRKEAEDVALASGIGGRLEVIPAANGDEVALGDPLRVRQIIRNLVENARRYGGTTIEIELFSDDATVTLEVRDDGPRLPADVANRVFAAYEHFDETIGTTESLGLGLTVSAQLAEMMHGEVRYQRRDHWTVFSLTLESAPSHPTDVLEPHLTATSGEHVLTRTTALPGPHRGRAV